MELRKQGIILEKVIIFGVAYIGFKTPLNRAPIMGERAFIWGGVGCIASVPFYPQMRLLNFYF